MRAFIALLCCIAVGAQAETFTAKVIGVLDGDTVLILHNGRAVKVRMANIDAPEVGHAGMGGKPPNSQKSQAFGKQSRESLLEMVGKKQVQIDSRAVDQYGRIVGLIGVDGRNVNQEQVKRGMAWAAVGWRQSRRAAPRPPEGRASGGVPFTGEPTGVPLAGAYSHHHSDKTYLSLQSDAQQAQRGLWAQANPQTPWQWRKLHPSVKPAVPNQPPASQRVVPVMLYDMECGKKRHCAQMSSCDEALFYLTRCGVKELDRNKDGEPCGSLCSGKN
jgi:endonuclease YncB( thermonuclease family)